MPKVQEVQKNATAERATETALLSIRGVSKSFGANEVLKNVSLDVTPGEFLTFLGESGSGKTTLLRLIAGLEVTSAGEIWMGGERIDGLPPYRRRVNTVFQQYALFPHLSVCDNVAYGLRIAGVPKNEIAERVQQALAMVKMSLHADDMPSKISGGQQQRVALARALVNRPRLLLLDEPLSALDANLRTQMQSELKSLQREVGITFIFVTHDQQEALAMSDRIALLRSGRLEQVASPRDIYQKPASAYVAKFLGQTNLIDFDIRSGLAVHGSISLPCGLPDGSAKASLRPESVHAAGDSPSPSTSIRFAGTITQSSFFGAYDLVTITCPLSSTLKAKLPPGTRVGTEAAFEFSVDALAFLADGSSE
jgi:spermidine/putrescine transport system ATP-binding protein